MKASYIVMVCLLEFSVTAFFVMVGVAPLLVFAIGVSVAFALMLGFAMGGSAANALHTRGWQETIGKSDAWWREQGLPVASEKPAGNCDELEP